jgi:hypothetical protein
MSYLLEITSLLLGIEVGKTLTLCIDYRVLYGMVFIHPHHLHISTGGSAEHGAQPAKPKYKTKKEAVLEYLLTRLVIDRKESTNQQELYQWTLTLSAPHNPKTHADSPDQVQAKQVSKHLLSSVSLDFHDLPSSSSTKHSSSVTAVESSQTEDNSWKAMICDPPLDFTPFDIVAFYSKNK